MEPLKKNKKLDVVELLKDLDKYEPRRRVDNLLTRHHLLDETINTGQTLLLGAEILAAALAQPGGGDHHHCGH